MNTSSDSAENARLQSTKRPATERDADFVRRTHHVSYRDVITKQFGAFDEQAQDEFFARSWKPETHQILIFEEEECGYLSFEEFDDHIFLMNLVLLPAFQGKGIGSQILRDT